MKRLPGWLMLLGIVIAALLAPVVFAGGPTGSGPDDPLYMTGAWMTLAPQTALWFYFDYAGDRSKIEVALDDYAATDEHPTQAQLAIFTPQQVLDWMQDPGTKPIGLGMPQKPGSAAAAHNLLWAGAFNFPGRFYAVVTNSTSTPMTFRLTITGTGVTALPTPTPTPLPFYYANPFATPISIATISGKLVFQEASGGNIYTVNGDGSNLKRVTSGLDPAWSPDGTQIAFARWNEPAAGLYIANADGSNEQGLVAASQLLSPRWSPDGKRIVYTRQVGGTLEDRVSCARGFCFTISADPHWKIGVVEIAKMVDVDVYRNVITEPPCSNHCFAPTWSPDNRTLVYADAGVGIMTTDTTTTTLSLLFNQTPRVQSPAWSPDGTKVAFQARQHDHWEIYVMDADGKNATAVTRADPLSFIRVNNVAPVWSPDSKQILFLSDRGGKWEFFVIGVDGSNLRQVLKNVSDTVGIYYNFSNERVMDWTK